MDEQQTGIERIDVERDRGVTLVFRDGFTRFYPNDDLRAACPCAACRGLRDQGEVVWPRDGAPTPARIEDAQLVGGWGVGLLWNDGHSTGIYPFDSLRAWDVDTDEPRR